MEKIVIDEKCVYKGIHAVLNNFIDLFDEFHETVVSQVINIILEDSTDDLMGESFMAEKCQRRMLKNSFYLALIRGYGAHYFVYVYYDQPNYNPHDLYKFDFSLMLQYGVEYLEEKVKMWHPKSCSDYDWFKFDKVLAGFKEYSETEIVSEIEKNDIDFSSEQKEKIIKIAWNLFISGFYLRQAIYNLSKAKNDVSF